MYLATAHFFDVGLQNSIDHLIKQDFAFLDSIFQTSISVENPAVFLHLLSTYLSNNISFDKNRVLDKLKSDLDKRVMSLFDIHYYLYKRSKDFDSMILPFLKNNFSHDTFYFLFKN